MTLRDADAIWDLLDLLLMLELISRATFIAAWDNLELKDMK